MSKRPSLENPGVQLWVDIVGVLLQPAAKDDKQENAAHVVANALSNLADSNDVVFRAQRALADMEDLLGRTVADPRRLLPHAQLLQRLKRVLDPRYFQLAWHKYKAQMISEDMISNLYLFDADISGTSLSPSDIDIIKTDIKSLQEKIAKANVSASWSSLLVGQLDLIDQSIARVNADGFASFRETVFCTIGRLELHLRVEPEAIDAEVVREIVDDLLRIVGVAQFGVAAAKAIPFLSGIAGYLPPPSGNS